MAFSLFEAYKRDVTEPVAPVTAQATRVRRQVIDFAAKIVRTAGVLAYAFFLADPLPSGRWTHPALHLRPDGEEG